MKYSPGKLLFPAGSRLHSPLPPPSSKSLNAPLLISCLPRPPPALPACSALPPKLHTPLHPAADIIDGALAKLCMNYVNYVL